MNEPSPIVAVIPFKGKVDMTAELVRTVIDGGHRVVCIANGERASADRKKLLAHFMGRRHQVEVAVSYADPNIHAWWNKGLRTAASYHKGGAHVAILNNDLELEPQALMLCGRALDQRWDLHVCSPNYDRRPAPGAGVLQPVTGICAGRYDGTGGIAGFAMVLSRQVAGWWRFSEDLTWWFGDAELTWQVEKHGGRMAIVLDAGVTHLDGGGVTGRWEDPEVVAVLAKDARTFYARYPELGEPPSWAM